MAQTLRYVDELVANFPDNTSGLINAVNIRDFAASFVNGLGWFETTTNVTIPITSGVPTAINPLLSGLTTINGGWGVDGNAFLFPDWANILADTVIPAGYSKLAKFMAVVSLTKSGGGTDNYQIQWARNGIPVGIAHDVLFTGAGSRTVTVPGDFLQDISVATDTFGLQITGIGTGVDIDLTDATFQVSDSILGTSP